MFYIFIFLFAIATIVAYVLQKKDEQKHTLKEEHGETLPTSTQKRLLREHSRWKYQFPRQRRLRVFRKRNSTQKHQQPDI